MRNDIKKLNNIAVQFYETLFCVCFSTNRIDTRIAAKGITKTVKRSQLHKLIFSGFAKADLAFIHTNRNTNYAAHEFDNIEIDSFDEYKEKRRFELSATVKYSDNSTEQKDK
jgi:hypothetical protein